MLPTTRSTHLVHLVQNDAIQTNLKNFTDRSRALLRLWIICVSLWFMLVCVVRSRLFLAAL